MSSRSVLASVMGLLLAVSLVLAQGAQPVPTAAEPPSPLELVRGLREAGMADLALEYLHELENRPLPDNDRKAIPLERARCLLEAAEEEPDEGTRTSMIGEAKEAFNDFLVQNSNHPRAAEALLAIARLTSIEAKAQLNRARRMEIPSKPPADAPDRAEREREREAAEAKQREEAKKAQPLFLLASKRFREAALQMKAKLEDKTIPPATRQNLAREAFDAELAAAINQYNLADTVIAANTSAVAERVKYLEEARDGFAKLAKGPPTSRTVWVARAWMAETLVDQSKPNDANTEFDAILKSALVEAEDGKRMVRFFQIRRIYLAAVGARSPAELRNAELALRNWLNQYGNVSRPTPETIAARYYRAFTLQLQAELALGPPSKDGKPQVIPQNVRTVFLESEKLYRSLTQSDNDYTARATRNRMFVVRKLLGDAEQTANTFATFEAAQMASLIQIAKLSDAERHLAAAETRRNEIARAGGKPIALIATELQRRRAEAEIPERKRRIVALLERARELATPQDNAGDVTDNLLRLVYFYQTADQPYQAAILGEHIARTIKSTGGKSAAAGLMALNGYMNAATQIKADRSDPSRIEELEAAAEGLRKIDRERAIELARYLDKAFPNDLATDAARHRLAALLVQDKHFDRAFEAITKVRAGYAQLPNARQLEGYIAAQLITSPAKDLPMPPGGKVAVFRRAIDDLARVVRPAPDAHEDEVRGYISVRARLAQLYLAQSRADEEREKQKPGYERALALADELSVMVRSFDCLNEKDGAGKKLNLDGQELELLAQDVRMRALYLRCRALVDGGQEKLPAATAALQPVIDDVSKTGSLMTDKMKQWAGGQGDPNDAGDVVAQKAKIAGLAAGLNKIRCDTVMLGFKLYVKQGKPDEAAKMLDLIKKAGGNVADNQSTYELMARELAAPIASLKKEKKDAEAKVLGDGVALLLRELAGVPNLAPSSVLFIGQTLYAVERHEDALKEFARIAVPNVPNPPGGNWWAVEPNNSQLFPDGITRKKFQDEVRDYRFAQLYTAKAYRGANKLADAEKLLTAIVGVAEKPGWGYASLDFRRELALLYEAKGAAISDPKTATPEWAKALKEWTTLFQIAQRRLQRMLEWEAVRPGLKAMLTDIWCLDLGTMGVSATPEQLRQVKSAFYDAFYEIQRVMVAANTQLQAANPAALNKSLEDVGKKIASMESSNKITEAGIVTETWGHFIELLDKTPVAKNSYKANGGKLFLERPRE